MCCVHRFVHPLDSVPPLCVVEIGVARHAEVGVLRGPLGSGVLEAFPQNPQGRFVCQVLLALDMEERGRGFRAAVVVTNGADEVEDILALGPSSVRLEFQADVGTDFADSHFLDDFGALKA